MWWTSVGEFGASQQISTRFASSVSNCSDVAYWRPTKLYTMFGRLLEWYTIYTSSGLLPPDGVLPSVKFTLRPSLAFSYIGSVTARHSSSERQAKFAACYKEWNYRTFAEGATYSRLGGHLVGHRPTFYSDIYLFWRENGGWWLRQIKKLQAINDNLS